MEQKKFDINSFIGMILLGGILLYWINTNKPDETIETSIKTEQVVASSKKSTESSNLFFENDSLKKAAISNALGAFAQSAINGSEGTSVLENELVKLTIHNKGGQIIEAQIKNYKTYDSLPLYMVKDKNASFNINFGTTDNRI